MIYVFGVQYYIYSTIFQHEDMETHLQYCAVSVQYHGTSSVESYLMPLCNSGWCTKTPYSIGLDWTAHRAKGSPAFDLARA